jgi:hypothetical protein
VFGVPVLSVALGSDLASHQARGVARGVIAVGDIAGLAIEVHPEGGTVIRLFGR